MPTECSIIIESIKEDFKSLMQPQAKGKNLPQLVEKYYAILYNLQRLKKLPVKDLEEQQVGAFFNSKEVAAIIKIFPYFNQMMINKKNIYYAPYIESMRKIIEELKQPGFILQKPLNYRKQLEKLGEQLTSAVSKEDLKIIESVRKEIISLENFMKFYMPEDADAQSNHIEEFNHMKELRKKIDSFTFSEYKSLEIAKEILAQLHGTKFAAIVKKYANSQLQVKPLIDLEFKETQAKVDERVAAIKQIAKNLYTQFAPVPEEGVKISSASLGESNGQPQYAAVFTFASETAKQSFLYELQNRNPGKDISELFNQDTKNPNCLIIRPSRGRPEKGQENLGAYLSPPPPNGKYLAISCGEKLRQDIYELLNLSSSKDIGLGGQGRKNAMYFTSINPQATRPQSEIISQCKLPKKANVEDVATITETAEKIKTLAQCLGTLGEQFTDSSVPLNILNKSIQDFMKKDFKAALEANSLLSELRGEKLTTIFNHIAEGLVTPNDELPAKTKKDLLLAINTAKQLSALFPVTDRVSTKKHVRFKFD